MQYVLVDDSVPFDGFTSERRSLGGAEKAFANLAAALAKRGHTVTVVNKTTYSAIVDQVTYTPIADLAGRPPEADVLIAFRQPGLLGAVRKAPRRLLWAVAQPDYLSAPAHAPLWESFKPTLLFVGERQQRAYGGALPNRVLAPAASSIFYDPPPPPFYMPDSPTAFEEEIAATPEPPPTIGNAAPPPRAVVTTHPLHGLVWITEIWRRLIHPRMKDARLAVYSTVLAKGTRGEDVPENIKPILERVKIASAEANVVVVDPRGDRGMAEDYRDSRVHFYPGHPQDYACWTLVESQAAGTPAIGRDLGGVAERVVNGQSAYLVPDAAAVANVALELLRDDTVYRNLSDAAADVTRRRTWEMVAMEVEETVARMPTSSA